MTAIKLRFPLPDVPFASFPGASAEVRSEAAGSAPTVSDRDDAQETQNVRRAVPNILSHRGCLRGRVPGLENTLTILNEAISQGFDVEFDIQQTLDQSGLVLAHDPAEWTTERNAVSFLTRATSQDSHALNVKNLATLPAIEKLLERARAKERFFLFDFELLSDNIEACRSQMRSLAERGFQIAYRVSEREPYLEDYCRDSRIEKIWLDEMEGPWVTQDHVHRLKESGKTIYYVSPELHNRLQPEALPTRWEQMVAWGVGAICTDYPLQLQHFLGEGRDD